MHGRPGDSLTTDIARYADAESLAHRVALQPDARMRWAELYITSCSSDAPFLPAPRRLSHAHHTAGSAQYYVVFPAWLVARLRRAGFETPDWLPSRPHEGRLLDRAHAVFAFSFAHTLASGVECFRIYVGLCPTRAGHGLWAAVEISSHMGRVEADMHDCASDCDRPHLLCAGGGEAPRGVAAGGGARVEMAFGDMKRMVHLSVGKSDRTLGSTNVSVLVIHVELGGLVYEQLEKRMAEIRESEDSFTIVA